MHKNRNNRKNVYDLENDVRNLNRQISQLTSELNEKRSELARHQPTHYLEIPEELLDAVNSSDRAVILSAVWYHIYNRHSALATAVYGKRKWVRIANREIEDELSFMSPSSIERHKSWLIKHGFMLRAQLRANDFDFANWYTLTNKTLAFFNKAGVRRSENV